MRAPFNRKHPPTLTVSCTPILTAIVGDVVGFSILGVDGVLPYVYSVSSGVLAPGWTLNPTTGVVSGTLSKVGSFSVTLTVTDKIGQKASRSFTTVVKDVPVVVPPTFTISANLTSSGMVGQAFTPFPVVPVGGTAPYTFSEPRGLLPQGLTVNPTTGIVSGNAKEYGTFSWIVFRCVDKLGNVATSLPIEIAIHPAGATICSTVPVLGQIRPQFSTDNEVVSLHGIRMGGNNSYNPDPEGSQYYGIPNPAPPPAGIKGPNPVPMLAYPCAVNRKNGLTNPINPKFTGGLWVGRCSHTADRNILDFDEYGLYIHGKDTVPTGIPVHEYNNSASLLMSCGGTVLSHELGRFDHCWDSIRPNPSIWNPTFTDNIKNHPGIIHCYLDREWVSYNRDDGIENDNLGSLTVTRSLFDRVYVFISSDPGGHVVGSIPTHELLDKITVDNTLIRMSGFLYQGTLDYVCPFKMVSDCSPSVVLTNSVIALDGCNPARSGRWKILWQRMTNGIGSCSNNVLCWMPDEPFPDANAMGLKTEADITAMGFTIYKGQEARDYWYASRDAFIAAPENRGIARLPGDE